VRQNCARSPGAQFGSKGNCNILLFDEVMGQNLSGGGHRAVVFSPSSEAVCCGGINVRYAIMPLMALMYRTHFNVSDKKLFFLA